MRWQSASDFAWELETVLPGFASPEEAALFSYGLTNPGADSLHLERGLLRLRLTNGDFQTLPDRDVAVYRLTANVDDPTHAEDADFSRVAISIRSLSERLHLDGELVFLAHRIIGPQEQPVDVSVELRQGGRLAVAVRGGAGDASPERQTSVPVSAIRRGVRD